MLVLDTTVLVYAAGSDHPLRDPCRRLLRAITDGAVAASTTVEVLQELAHVRARRRTRADAERLAVDALDLLAPLVAVTDTHLRRGLTLFSRSERLGCFDAVLAAVVLDEPGATLVSADRAFAEVEGLATVYPDAAGVASLLA